MDTFVFWPNQIVIKRGAAKSCYKYLMDKENVILFTDENLSKTEYFKAVYKELEKEIKNISIFKDIKENPDETDVNNAVEIMKKIKPDSIICYGGGSVIDLGKAANLMYTHTGDIREYEDTRGGIEKIKNKMLPFIAIPTTAGTGSEVSAVSVITDSVNIRKMAIISKYLIPDISLLDANTLNSIPDSLFAYTGIDALTHCIEAYISSEPFEPGKGFAIQGVRLISNYLRKAMDNPSDKEAREKILIASACGALAFNNNFLGTVHACAHQLSTIAGIPHGLANSIMLIPVLKWNREYRFEEYKELAQAFGLLVDGKSPDECADLLINAIDELIKYLNIPRKLSQLGVSEKTIEVLVEKAYLDHNNLTNPRKDELNTVSKKTLRELYMEVL